MVETSPVQVAPGELEFVRAFVNTRDVEAGTDRLRDARSWHDWARSHNLRGFVSEADLELARRIREGLRAGLVANHERSPLPAATVGALNTAAERAAMTVRFDPRGASLHGTGSGVTAAFVRLVSAAAGSIADGSWTRLKVCVNDDCQWGFYDQSRSRTAQWCSMRICGNRAKQSRWRAAHQTAD